MIPVGWEVPSVRVSIRPTIFTGEAVATQYVIEGDRSLQSYARGEINSELIRAICTHECRILNTRLDA